MARVNHKRVKQLMNEKRSRISDKQFFTSRMLAGHFEDMAMAQTKRYNYGRRVHVRLVWKPKMQDCAHTDSKEIRINAGHPVVTKMRGRQNRYLILCGLFAHELAHVLYTDFLCMQTYQNSLTAERWYPATPVLVDVKDKRNERAIWDYIKSEEKNKTLFLKMAHIVFNIFEDGYIEHRFLTQFPGTLGYGLEKLRERQWSLMPTVTQMIEQEEEGAHICQSIFQIMLCYALYGEIKYGDEPLTDERIQAVFGLIDEIDRAVLDRSAKDRFDIVNLIIVRLWDYIEDYLEQMKNMQEEMEASGNSISSEELLEQMIGGMQGMSSGATGLVSMPVEETGDTGQNSGSATAGNRAVTHAKAEQAASGDSGESEQEDEAGSSSGEESDETEESGPSLEESGGMAPETDAGENETEVTEMAVMPERSSSTNSTLPESSSQSSEIITASGNSGKQKVSDKDTGGRIPQHQTTDVLQREGSTTRNEDYKRECDEHAATDIERVLEQMAERAACEELENDRLRELNEVAQSISYGNIHEGFPVRVNRIARVDEELEEQYEQVAGPLEAISRQMQKSLIKQLKESRRGGKLTGLMMGRRMDAHALCRNDGKIFYKNSLPNEIPEMAVGLLLDESGSMCSCDRSTYARATAVILYDFCRSLDIPVMVYGHSTGYTPDEKDVVDLYSYAEFESIDQDDKYRMMDIGARGGNRDGAALRFVAEQLAKRPEEIKILMIVSDGQPADTGYHGTAAEEDLRGIRQEYQRKKILFVAAAIGDDKANIERIYGDSFMDITDLGQLPIKLTGVVKRHIRL